MTLSSMTGFARVTGALPPLRWVWELKSVNGRGLDLRLRLPPGFDAMEPAARAALGEALARGNCTANLTLARDGTQAPLRVNEASLAAVAAAIDALARRFPQAAPRLRQRDILLGLIRHSAPARGTGPPRP